MAITRLDAPTDGASRQELVSGVVEFIWKDTANNMFLDTTACIFLDREIELIERGLSIEGAPARQIKPADGGARVTIPTGAPVRQSAVV